MSSLAAAAGGNKIKLQLHQLAPNDEDMLNEAPHYYTRPWGAISSEPLTDIRQRLEYDVRRAQAMFQMLFRTPFFASMHHSGYR